MISGIYHCHWIPTFAKLLTTIQWPYACMQNIKVEMYLKSIKGSTMLQLIHYYLYVATVCTFIEPFLNRLRTVIKMHYRALVILMHKKRSSTTFDVNKKEGFHPVQWNPVNTTTIGP